MKISIISLIVAGMFIQTTNAFSYDINNQDGYMQGHPSSNDSYYSPSYNNRVNSPNYNSNYYNDTYGRSNNVESNTPQGNDIRDYNPYYDREGKLRN